MADLTNLMPFMNSMPEIQTTDNVEAGFMNGYLSQLFSNDRILMESGRTGRNQVVVGPYTAKGVPRLLRDRYSENLCYGGTPISGGDYAGYPKDNAFDGTPSTDWASSQTNNAVSGVAYLGYDFGSGVTKHIRRLSLTCVLGGTYLPSSVKIQNSSDGTAWMDVVTVNAFQGKNIIDLPVSTATRFWRVLANANLPTASAWHVNELELYELIDSTLANNDLVIPAGGLINFAAGQGPYGNIDFLHQIRNDVVLAGLPAANNQTIPSGYTDDVCNGGTAISGGDYAGYPAVNAFDNNPGTYWGSSQASANQSGVAWIGYNFGRPVAIRKIRFQNSINIPAIVPSVKIEYSEDGITWSSAGTFSVDNTVSSSITNITIPAVGSYQYWRIRANANNTSPSSWGIYEIEMYEALQTYYIYATRALDGTISYGYTRQKPKSGKPSQSVITSQGIYTNLCVGGTPISGGDLNSDRNKANAFDGLDVGEGSTWASAQSGTSVSGAAYIGYNFGIAKTVHRVYIAQAGNNSQDLSSVKIQYHDGTTWQTAKIATIPKLTPTYVDLDTPVTAQMFRLLANGNTASGYCWCIYELQFLKYNPPVTIVSSDDLIYTDNIAVGGAAISSGDLSSSSIPGAGPKEWAFDGNPNSYWNSIGSGAFSTRYIGYDFGVARKIKRITINVFGGYFTPTAKVQYSTDGSSWSDAETVNIVNGANTFRLAGNNSARYWRILGQGTALINGSTNTSDGLCAYEITMHEICTDLTHYDPYIGVSRYYDGNTWANIVRKFLGEVVVDGTGRIVSTMTYPYGLGKLLALPAEGPDEVVTLGQFGNSLAQNGWQRLPGGLILQWGKITGIASTADNVVPFTYPIMFPNAILMAPVGNVDSVALAAVIGLYVRDITTSGASFVLDKQTMESATIGVHWFAIGY